MPVKEKQCHHKIAKAGIVKKENVKAKRIKMLKKKKTKRIPKHQKKNLKKNTKAKTAEKRFLKDKKKKCKNSPLWNSLPVPESLKTILAPNPAFPRAFLALKSSLVMVKP